MYIFFLCSLYQQSKKMNSLINSFVVLNVEYIEYVTIVVFPFTIGIRFHITGNICCFNAAIKLVYLILPHLIFNRLNLRKGI